MKTLYVQFFSLLLLWLMVGQPTLAQTIPDVQWSTSASQGLAIRTDGNIATTDNSARQEAVVGTFIPVRAPATYALSGNRISITTLNGVTILNSPSRPFGSFFTSVLVMAATTNNETGYVGYEYNTSNTLITKLNASGTGQVWTKTISPGDYGGSYDGFQALSTFQKLIGTPDGGFLLVVVTERLRPVREIFTTLIKYDAAGNATTRRVVNNDPNFPMTGVSQIINTPDGGYLITGSIGTINQGSAFSPGFSSGTSWAAKLNGQLDIVWQRRLDNLPVTSDINGPIPESIVSFGATEAVLAADGNGYALAGTGRGPSSAGVAPSFYAILELNNDGSFKRARALSAAPNPAPQLYIARYTSGGQPYYALATTVDGQPQILLVNPANLSLISQRTFINSSAFGTLRSLAVAGDGSLVFNTTSNALVKLRAETTGGFTLLQPTYNCQTGAIVFNTSGGDGSPVTYSAPGIMRASPTSNSGTVEPGLRADPKTIPITATQSGQTSTVIFDLAAFCTSTPEPPVFTLLAPTYNCQTGAITFNVSGSDGSPITYSAPGIMRASPTSNSGTVEAGLRADPKTIPITATQSGQTSTVVFDLPGQCGRQARIGSPESGAGLGVVVLGNPTLLAVSVAVSGAEGQALQLELLDARGRVVGQRAVERAGARETHTFEVGQQAGGLFMVRATSGTQTHTVKVLKQ